MDKQEAEVIRFPAKGQSAPKRKCNRTSHPTERRAQEVLWIMSTKGIDTGRLRVIKCKDCSLYHLQYVSR